MISFGGADGKMVYGGGYDYTGQPNKHIFALNTGGDDIGSPTNHRFAIVDYQAKQLFSD